MHMATGFDAWVLTLTTFTPIVGLALVLLIPKVEEQLIKVVTLATTLVTLGFAGMLYPIGALLLEKV